MQEYFIYVAKNKKTLMAEKKDLILLLHEEGKQLFVHQDLLQEINYDFVNMSLSDFNCSNFEQETKETKLVLIDIDLLADDEKYRCIKDIAQALNCVVIFITSEKTATIHYSKAEELKPYTYLPDTAAGELTAAVIKAAIAQTTAASNIHGPDEISGLRKYLQSIQDSEEQFKMVWDKSIDGMRLVDIEGKTLLVNEAFCRLVGKTKEQLEGKDFSEIYNYSITEISDPAVRRSILQKFKERILADEIEPFFEKELYLWNGKKVWFQLSNAILKQKNGNKVVLSIFRDISERKEYEEKLNLIASELKELNDSKDKFISILSHDLRGPFHGFLGITEVLAHDLESFSKEEIKESAEMLNRALKNQFLLLEDLLTWSRIQTKRIEFNIEKIQILNEVYSIIYLLQPNAEKKNIEIICNIGGDTEIECDKSMLKLLFRNLIANAIKFSYRGGKVIINSKLSNNGIILSVADSGMGISEEDIQKLFRTDIHFTQKGTDDESGTGLGLILCKEIVDLHKGKIWVNSKVGAGSTFNIFFPIGDK